MSTLALPQLIGKFVETGHFTPDEANALLTALTITIEQGLKNGKSVSVPGMGTFRAVVVSNEVSVDFAPDSALAAEINAPFALFEPVELPDGVTEEDIEPEDTFTINPGNEITALEATENQDNAAQPLPTPPPLPQSISRQSTPDITATEQTDEPDDERDNDAVNEKDNYTADNAPGAQEPTTASVSEPSPIEKIIEREKVVEIHPDSSHHTLNIILTAVISLLAGLLIGYFVPSHLNLGHVKNVNIEADGVTVYPTENQTPGSEAAKTPAASAEQKSTEVDNSATGTAETDTQKVTAKATVITDTVRTNRYLTTMALQHYGKKKFWVYIYQENKSILSDPDNIAPNTVVVIPPADKYDIRPGDKESEAAAERLAAQIYQGQ